MPRRHTLSRFAWWLAAAAGLWAVPSVQAQSPGAVSLAWHAPPGCPGAAAVVRELGSRWPKDMPAAAVEVRGEVRCDGPAHCTLDLHIRGAAEGERRLEAQSCDGFAEAAAVLVLVSLDAAQAPAPALEAAPPSPRARPPWQASLEAAFTVDVGLLPSAQPGGSVALGGVRGAYGVGLEASAFRRARQSLGEPGAEVAFGLWELVALAWAAWPEGPVRFGPSLGLGLTSLRGTSAGVPDGSSSRRFLLTPRLGARVRWELGRGVSLRAGAELLVPLPGSSWRVKDFTYEHVVPAVTGRFHVGLGVRFW